MVLVASLLFATIAVLLGYYFLFLDTNKSTEDYEEMTMTPEMEDGDDGDDGGEQL